MSPRRSPLALAALLLAAPVFAQDPSRPIERTVTGTILHPGSLPPTPDRLSSLRLPPGFRIERWADGLENPRIVKVGPRGGIYVSQRKPQNVLLVRDTDGDGVADVQKVVAKEPNVHGIAFSGDQVFLVGIHHVWRATVRPDGTFGPRELIITGLPDAGQHPNRTIEVGPDRKLYISIGSATNAAAEPNVKSATMMVANLDGTGQRIYASGLRNTIGYDWHPRTRALYGWDQGSDWKGDDECREEINRIVPGKRYGWPYLYENGKQDPQQLPSREGYTIERWRRESMNPELTYTAHSAGMQFRFYTGSQFPAEYRGDVFATLHGSWNRSTPSGYEVVRIRFSPEGRPQRVEPFLTGFIGQNGGQWQQFGRPCGLAQLPDGSLLVSDDAQGALYRISYGAAGARAMAFTRTDTTRLTKDAISAPNTIVVKGAAFGNGGMIPDRNSDYGGKKSPALRLGNLPKGTKSLVLLMEDPDAAAPRPFVHWLIANVPPSAMVWPEGIPTTERPAVVPGAVQGGNSRGTVGYFGPRPPAGDPPHRYHFTVLALDRKLNLPPGFNRQAVWKAVRGHVLAQGTAVGRYASKR